MFKLHKTLYVFQLNDKNIKDIITLTRYVYSEESRGGGLDEGIKGLKSLVCQYIAINTVVLSFNDRFIDLLKDSSQLVKDFFKYEA